MEVAKLAHSYSQPGGMDRTPPYTPKKGGKMLAIKVQLLDDTVTMFQIQAKALGRILFEQVCNQLNLLETDYFGLEYQEAGGTKYWLDLEKPICRQIGLSLVDTLVRFCVKFYTPDPSQLEEEFTRYLFCLQIKRDLSQGLLQCNSNTAALMASYIVQAECGDFVVEDYPDHRYLSSYKFVPNQDQEMERRIMENHKKLVGQSPAEADLNLLETARRCELYGIKMHPAKDHEGCPLNLAVAHMGIVVFQNFSKINTFSWAKMRKISFKRKRFLVKLHPEGYGYYKDTVEFFFEGRNECKNFWKKCVENHGFFRCTMVKKVPRQKTRVLSRGSSFRYSGRTQKQIVDFVRENYVKRQTFQRSQSFRHSSSAHSSVANVGTSISAHPLLPLGDNAVAGTPASLSCGSMTLTSSPIHTADIHAGASPSPPLTTSISPGTSVTSSPQHFYPQETPYRRTDHRPTKVKRSPVFSHRAISPLLSPADGATAATNLSANHSNDVAAVGSSDIVNFKNSLKYLEFVDFNDVYSNCYTSLRSLGNAVDVKYVDGERKTDIFSLPSDFLNATSKSNESIGSLSRKSKALHSSNNVDVDGYMWHRSASCKELYREAEIVMGKEEESNGIKASDLLYDLSIGRHDKSVRKCYSAVTSKNPSIERTGDVRGDMRLFSSSYPGTTSSLSTESAEGELEDRIVNVVDLKYNSQEEIALSHDDVSHDSYELLERELDEYSNEAFRSKRSRIVGDNERTRSCSWGPERGINPLDFRSSENVICFDIGDETFWPIEKDRNLKHKSEIDFRSFSHKGSKECHEAVYKFEGNSYNCSKKKGKTPEFLAEDNRFGKRAREWNEREFEKDIRKSPLDRRIFGSKIKGDKEFNKIFCEEIKSRRAGKEEKENFEAFERKKYQSPRKSLQELEALTVNSQDFSREMGVRMEDKRRMEKRREKKEREERFHEGLNEKKQIEWEREKERRQIDRRRSIEQKELRGEDDPGREIVPNLSDYANFQEIHFKQYERVVSNQFGQYPEFLNSQNTYEFISQEKKVMENYEKVCQVSKLAKELQNNENNSTSGSVIFEQSRISLQSGNGFGEPSELEEWKIAMLDLMASPKIGRAHVERTKSDPYSIVKNQKRNILMHQKSIDLTPQQSEETASDYDNEDGLKKASRSEHDIPYILHKRHCMNGTARNTDFIFSKTDLKTSCDFKALNPSEHETRSVQLGVDNKKLFPKSISKGLNSEEVTPIKQKSSYEKVGEAKKAGVQIINLDVKNGKTSLSIVEHKKVGKSLKPPTVKKPETKPTTLKTTVKKDPKKVERSFEHSGVSVRAKTNEENFKKSAKITDGGVAQDRESEEPIYAEVCPEKGAIDDGLISPDIIPPELPKRTSSFSQKSDFEEKKADVTEKKLTDKRAPAKKSSPLKRGEPPTKKASISQPPESVEEKKKDTEVVHESKSTKGATEVGKSSLIPTRIRQDGSFTGSVLQRREESLTLFARTRLGLSEGSAFAPIVRQGRVGSPSSQRRAKSLDAPYVSVHSLPPADAFSSKDDTVDEKESDIVDSAVARFEEFCKGEAKKNWVDTPGNTESENVFTDDVDLENNFKKTVESQLKVEIPCLEEKILDVVRGKRLLSKIESVDIIDSEGDLDSSKLAECPPIPSDRLVNLPESIRFPSVRQISGQTSEESADGWDQKEVKVKRRTPRRSVGREEQDTRSKESVVWGSRDEEPPDYDDDVWEDSSAPTGKYEGVIMNVGLPTEYLKRGSCGQSIDDDNLSTPMKESSPEHWVSVDDLPEALEREEKLLKQQEKILKEKILNEKLKRELNLDTIDVDERYCDYRDSLKQSRYDEEPTSLKENFKGHSLDTYELNEKKMKERRGNKNFSLDEQLLPNKLVNGFGGLEGGEKTGYQKRMDYIQCKVVKDVAEIDQFGDNDEELEEFFVVLDENLEKEEKNPIWDDEDIFKRTLSNDDSLISVPEEFKDAEKEEDSLLVERVLDEKVEIRLSEVEGGGGNLVADGHHTTTVCLVLSEKLDVLRGAKNGDSLIEDNKLEDFKSVKGGDAGRLSPFSGSRRGSEENRKLSLSEDTGRLSPYDSSSRRSSDDPKRCSASEDSGRLSPFNDSRRGSEDPRRLSNSEDSRKCSMSESVSEETRKRLSSTEETRRKRASLTKQCSVGAESLSDEVISGIQECSSSFEQDEKDVFEPEPAILEHDREIDESSTSNNKGYRDPLREMPCVELSEETLTVNESLELRKNFEDRFELDRALHLAPPTSERELSRETEDSVDYGEGDFKDIREVVKEKDISDGLICDHDAVQLSAQKLGSSFEKSESTEGDELRFIDEKRGSTPEILMGKSREAVAISIVVVNEGISVLNKIKEKGHGAEGVLKSQSLPRAVEGTSAKEGISNDDQRHTLPKTIVSKPKDYVHRKLTKIAPEIKVNATFSQSVDNSRESIYLLKNSLDSSQDSDLDKLCDFSLVTHVQSQIAKRNLSDAGKSLRRDELEEHDKMNSSEDDAFLTSHKTSSDEKEKTENSSFELKSSADELVVAEDTNWKDTKVEKGVCFKSGFEPAKRKKEGSYAAGRDKKSPDQEKRDSGEDGSSSSSAPLYPKRELSSTWKPFLLESSGSSSLEEGWLPPDENAHLADEEETSSTSNNQQDDSCHDDADYPTGTSYPVLNMPSAEMVVGGYGSVFALSRTLSRISERSTSEQERSDVEDDITKLSSRSVSVEEESIMSSDHQPSLSSDPPSPKESTSTIPDLPVDKPIVPEFFEISEDKNLVCEPFGDVIPPPLPEEDWPSPPSSFSVADTPLVSHVETFYMEIHPEEACKVVVAEPHDEGGSSSDENQTLQEESEFLHLSSDNMSASTTTTTQDGTVVIPVRPMAGRTSSLSEDVSMISTSEWSSPTTSKPRPNSNSAASEDISERTKSGVWQERQTPVRGGDICQSDTSNWSTSPSKYCRSEESQKPKTPVKIKPLQLSSPTGKTFGFFETPVSKVRSPTSQVKFFDAGDKGASGYSTLRSPTSYSETTSPKNYKRFFDGSGSQVFKKSEAFERRASKSPTKGKSVQRGVCTPYYSNVADSAEKSYFGRYDTGSLERTKIQSSRKCYSFFSMTKTVPNEGDSSNSDGATAPSPNTIPRATKKTRKRHRVAMDLLVRDGKIVAPPKTKATVVENSDSDRSSPREHFCRETRKRYSDF